MDTKLKAQIENACRVSEQFLIKMGKGSGVVPQPVDTRDYQFTAVSTAMTQLPTVAELGHQSPVRDQGQLGSCTGFATCAAVEHLRRTDADQWSTIYSPLFVYYHARKAINLVSEDTGAYIRDAVKSVSRIGVAPESQWMYYEVHNTFDDEPSERAMKEATRWKLGGYYAVNSLAELRRALANGYPVVGGFVCFDNLSSPYTWNTGIIQMPSGTMAGAHAVCFVGYDDNTKLVKFKNSWGTYWGDEGYGYLPYAFFEQNYVFDMWALIEESDETVYPKRK